MSSPYAGIRVVDLCGGLAAGYASKLLTDGGADVVISNAATGVLKPAADFTDKHWRAVMDVNALAFLKLAQGFAPRMPPGGRWASIWRKSVGPK